jgi:thiol-disulfide isomerase/thioredoxin
MLLAALAGACDDKDGPAPAPTARTDSVGGTAKSPSARPITSGATTGATTGRTAPRDICAGEKERDAPPTIGDARAASGATPPPAMTFGNGRWVWLNVWAAWCEPCKAEMPMLIRWRDKLKGEGVQIDLAFVSIDDDERELDRFLAAQPPSGMRASFWLPETGREEWFEKLGFHGTPTLPVHALVNPSGKLGCAFEGALEEVDYPRFAGLVRR